MEKEKFEGFEDLDELDDLDLDDLEEYSLTYDIIAVGYDYNDDETNYSLILDSSGDQRESLLKADNIIKTDLKDLTEDEYYVRINVVPTISSKDFHETQETLYSRVIIIK